MPIVSPMNPATMTSTVGPAPAPAPAPAPPKQPDNTNASSQEPKVPGEKEFSALARKERQMRHYVQSQQQKIQAERAELEAARAEIAQAKSWQTRLPEDPWSVMLEAGLTPQQISERVFSPEAMQKYNLTKYQTELEKKVQTQIDELKQAQAQTVSAQYEQAKRQIAQDVNRLVQSEPEAFRTLRAVGPTGREAVLELIVQTFNRTGMMMDIDKAAQEVEEHLASSKEVEDHLYEQARSLTSLEKIRSRLNPGVSGAQKQNQTQQPQVNTLSNRTMPSTSTPMSARERRERAIAAFQGQL